MELNLEKGGPASRAGAQEARIFASPVWFLRAGAKTREEEMANEVRVAAEPLTEFTREVFVRAGFSREDAALQAEVLVWANLRGVDSHGVLRIPVYLDFIDKGWMKPRAKIQIEKETPATLLVDADCAPGPVVTTFAMTRVIEKARSTGIGWGLIRNTTHQGAMAYYSLMAAEAGLAGLAIVCSPPNMAPYGAKAPGLHNSPITIAVPARRHRPLVLDMATSVAAGGKLPLAVDKGIPIPLGWALTRDGEPTTDAKQAKILLPVGGPKGSGLALMFECLTGIMVGNPLLEPALQAKDQVRRHRQNGVVAAIDIATFTDLEGYRTHVDMLIDELKALPKSEGTDEILVPGEIEDRVCADRSNHGIPLPKGTAEKLRMVAQRFSLPLPVGL
jgi:LDH2 family malate/lactate/ureidoglycolate dehydrogenase